jgi:hypothetical protein
MSAKSIVKYQAELGGLRGWGAGGLGGWGAWGLGGWGAGGAGVVLGGPTRAKPGNCTSYLYIPKRKSNISSLLIRPSGPSAAA